MMPKISLHFSIYHLTEEEEAEAEDEDAVLPPDAPGAVGVGLLAVLVRLPAARGGEVQPVRGGRRGEADQGDLQGALHRRLAGWEPHPRGEEDEGEGGQPLS